MAQYQVERILRDRFLAEEIESHPAMAIVGERPTLKRPKRPPRPEAGTKRATPSTSRMREAIATRRREAIVFAKGRPSLPIRSDSFEVPHSDTWKARLYPTKSKLEAAIRSVGRIEVDQLAPYEGTGWMIAPGIIVTNRHVAERFASRGPRSTFRFLSAPLGERLTTLVDFREEEFVARDFEVRVTDVLYMTEHSDRAPDIAFLRVKLAEGDDRPLPLPIPLYEDEPTADQTIAVVGYPARDPDASPDLQARVFGSRFDIKRLAPGEVMETVDSTVFTHDASTLGGSSGSVVLDVATGAALGLHYAGHEGLANYAVNARVLRRTLERALRGAEVRSIDPTAAIAARPERAVRIGHLNDRTGYDAEFLGDGTKRVPLPKLTPAQVKRAARMRSRGGSAGNYVLPYHHFSVVVDKPRRMARYSAVNIDGALIQRLKRKSDPWAFDPRIRRNYQLGNALYAGNELDRGHLVRRLDPVWDTVAEDAEMDTYFFTNCSPQVAHFNQTLWGDLEDYILEHAVTQNFRASVFTGPVLDDSRDPPYRDALLPGAYWKVAAIVRADTDEVAASGYLVSQSDLLSGVEFVYGQFKTYQLPIKRIERLTGLDFGTLRTSDSFIAEESIASRELVSFEDIQL